MRKVEADTVRDGKEMQGLYEWDEMRKTKEARKKQMKKKKHISVHEYIKR